MLRRDQREGAGAALPRRGRLAVTAHSWIIRSCANGGAGALRGLRGRAVAAHELVRRGARRIALRTQPLVNEAGGTDTAMGGSFFIESLTSSEHKLVPRGRARRARVAAVEWGSSRASRRWRSGTRRWSRAARDRRRSTATRTSWRLADPPASGGSWRRAERDAAAEAALARVREAARGPEASAPA